MDSLFARILFLLISIVILVVPGYGINQLPSIPPKPLLTSKLILEALVLTFFFEDFKSVFEASQNTSHEASKIHLTLVVLYLFLFLQTIYHFIMLCFGDFLKRTLRWGKTTSKRNPTDDCYTDSSLNRGLNQLSATINRNRYSGDSTIDSIKSEINIWENTTEQRKRAAEWVATRCEDWVNSLKIQNYRRYGVTNENSSIFFHELKQHIELLKQNLLDGRNSSPKLSKQVKITRYISSSIPYRIALVDIQALIQSELEQDEQARTILGSGGIQMLNDYLNTLIEFIDQ